jgi:hypothetical protein
MTATEKRFNKNADPMLKPLPMVDLIIIVMQLVISQIKMTTTVLCDKKLSILKK